MLYPPDTVIDPDGVMARRILKESFSIFLCGDLYPRSLSSKLVKDLTCTSPAGDVSLAFLRLQYLRSLRNDVSLEQRGGEEGPAGPKEGWDKPC